MKKIFLFLTICLALTVTSCKDSDDCSVNRTINSTIYIMKSGLQTISTTDLTDGVYKAYIYNGGFNENSFSVGLVAADTVLTNYNKAHNTTFVALPEKYYSIGANVALTHTNYNQPVSITFDIAAIKADGIDNTYVLPLTLKDVPSALMGKNNHELLIRFND